MALTNEDKRWIEARLKAFETKVLVALRLTPEQRSASAAKAGAASKAKLTPEQRSAIARKAGLAGGRGRKKEAK